MKGLTDICFYLAMWGFCGGHVDMLYYSNKALLNPKAGHLLQAMGCLIVSIAGIFFYALILIKSSNQKIIFCFCLIALVLYAFNRVSILLNKLKEETS